MKREGDDITLIATSSMVYVALEAAELLAEEGVHAEVVDPRTLVPLDRETLVASVSKTGRAIVIDEGHQSYGASAELAAVVAEGAFWHLDAPVRRLGAMDVPIPFSPVLEDETVPTPARVVEHALSLVGKKRRGWRSATYGTMGVDWEQRVDFDRLRRERLAQAKEHLEGSELGALLCFDMNNIRYLTATHIGTWAMDKLIRFALLPRGGEPILWDFGSAARHHQLYCPWLGEERSRAGISTLRGAVEGRAESVARKIRVELEEHVSPTSRSASTWSSCPCCGRSRRRGSRSSTGRRSCSDARTIKTVDEITLLTTACAMVDSAYDELYKALRPGFRENECVALVNRVSSSSAPSTSRG